jgi:phosphatidylserine decarboxylase
VKGIPLAKEGLVFVVPSLVLSLLFLTFHLYILSFICFFLCAFFLYFFRHPKRVCQSPANLLISPADGRVMGIDELDEEEFIKGRALRVSIFMGVADVHVNRAPCEGVISRIVHRPGHYEPAYKKDCHTRNERNYILLERDGEKLLLVQIAGILARRIHCWVREKDVVRRGQPVGMIAFGSRVDIYTPQNYEIMVQLNQKVKSGVTPLARKRGDA